MVLLYYIFLLKCLFSSRPNRINDGPFNGYRDCMPANKVSISPTFYEQFFCTNVFCKAFLSIQIGFVNFGKRMLAQNLLVKFW